MRGWTLRFSMLVRRSTSSGRTPPVQEGGQPIVDVEIDRTAIDVQERILLEQLVLLGGPFGGRCLARGPRLGLNLRGKLRDLAIEDRRHNRVEFGQVLFLHLAQLGGDGGGLLPIGIGPE